MFTFPSGLFVPPQIGIIPDPVIWLDAYDIPQVENFSIQEWTGKAGRAFQDTAAVRPILKTTGLNSKPTVFFDSDHLFCEVPGIQSASTLELFAVFQTPTTAGNGVDSVRLFGYGSIGPNASNGFCLVGQDTELSWETVSLYYETPSFTSGSLGSSTYSRSANIPQVIYVKLSTLGTSLRANRVPVSLNLSFEIDTNTSTSPANCGWTTDSNLILGGYRSGTNISTALSVPDVNISELMVYIDSDLSESDIQAVESYLNSKWIL